MRQLFNLPLACLALTVVAGCSTPNSPGQGSGKSYTPVIDMSGVDPGRYTQDLDSCRAYASQINEGKATLAGALGGALVGAMLANSFGLHGSNATGVVNTGVISGMGASGGKAVLTQEQIMRNCMAGRGYRVLDGAAQPIVIQSPMNSLASPAAQPMGGSATAAAAPPTAGKWIVKAARATGAAACPPDETPKLVDSSGARETYSLPCGDGRFLTIECTVYGCTTQ